MCDTTLEVAMLADVSGAYSAILSVYQCVVVTLIYELNCSYRNLSLHSKVQLEKLNTTAIKRSYYNN